LWPKAAYFVPSNEKGAAEFAAPALGEIVIARLLVIATPARSAISR